MASNIEHGYNVNDLIVTKKKVLGVVLATEKESLKIMTQNGNVQNVDINDVSNKIIQKQNMSSLGYIEGANKNLNAIGRNILQITIYLSFK